MLLNPGSGNGKNNKKLAYVCKRLEEKYNVQKAISSNLNEFENIIHIASREISLLVVMGGDGTIHKAINVLINQKVVPLLGYIPIGTMCDMAINLGIPKNTKKAVKIILAKKTRMWSLTKFNDVIMTYIMAKGRMVSASYDTDQRLKKMGKMGYALNGFLGLFDSKKFNVEILLKDRKIIEECCFLGVIKGRAIANLKLKKEYNCLVLFKKNFFLSSVRIALGRKIKNTKNCIVLDLNQDFVIHVMNDETKEWSFDGEKASMENIINVYPKFAQLEVIYNSKRRAIS